MGEIAELGSQVVGYSVGQKVFVAPNMGFGRNRATISGNNNMDPDFQATGINLDGAFAEYMRVPALAIQQGNLMPIELNVDPAVAALIEPLACVLRGQNALNVRSGDIVVVMGAGPIGMLHVKLANLRGALRVIVSEPAAGRREQALALGADRVVDPVSDNLYAVVMEERRARCGCDHRRCAIQSGAGIGIGHCGNWWADQFFRRSAQTRSVHQTELKHGALQGIDRDRNDGMQYV